MSAPIKVWLRSHLVWYKDIEKSSMKNWSDLRQGKGEV